MSIGIDLGNDYMVVTAIRQGVDVLQNDIGKRKTRVAVTYNADSRDIGDDSFSQYLSKYNFSAMYPKRLMGKQYGLDDEDIEKEKRFLPNKFTGPAADGTPAPVKYVIPRVGEVPPEQALCTMLLKAKNIYEINSEGQHVQECVITVPTDWNNAQRLAMIQAADMAGLKVLELANETTCVLYQYGLQRDIQDTRLVMFYDIGATTTSCTLARITKETGEVLAYESNSHLGGRDFIECIVEEVAKWCKEKKNITVEPNSKPWLKIRRACEKTFHTLSANQQASVSVENVLDGVDISLPYTRESFYAILEARFKDQIIEPIQRIIQQYPTLMVDGKLQVNYFEIIGGVTRVPLVQQLLISNFGVTLSKTLDADEAIARGAALRCAALSTTKKIRRKFQVTDKRIGVELFLYKGKEGMKEGDALGKLSFAEDDVILSKSFQAAYPTTYPQPRLLSLRFQQVQLPAVVGLRMNGSKHDNVRSIIFPQSKVDGRLFAETADGNVPVDIKVSLALNSSGYMHVYHVETVPQKVEVPAPQEQQQQQQQQDAAAPTTMNDGEQQQPPQDQAAPATDATEPSTETKSEEQPMGENSTEGEQPQQQQEAAPPTEGEQTPSAAAPEPTMTDTPQPVAAAVVQQAKPIPLITYNQTIGALSDTDLQAARTSEKSLQTRDEETKKRQEVYNNLESHLFTTRSRLGDADDLPRFMTPEQAQNASVEIKKVLDWLDDEGYDAELSVLEAKLKESEKFTHGANIRLHNWKNLESAQFAYRATIDQVIEHKFVSVEKFASQVTPHQVFEEQARKVLDEKNYFLDVLPVTSQQVDQRNNELRHVLHAMNHYDPEKERLEELRRQEEAKKRTAAEEAQKAAMAAQQAAQQAAAAQQQAQQQQQQQQAQNEAAAPSCEQPQTETPAEQPQQQEQAPMGDEETKLAEPTTTETTTEEQPQAEEAPAQQQEPMQDA